MLRALITALALTTATMAVAEDRGAPTSGEPTIFTNHFWTTAFAFSVPLVVLAITAASVDNNDSGGTATSTSTSTRTH